MLLSSSELGDNPPECVCVCVNECELCQLISAVCVSEMCV